MGALLNLAMEQTVRNEIWPLVPRLLVDCHTDQIIGVTPPCARMLGYDPDEILGPDIHYVIPGWKGCDKTRWDPTKPAYGVLDPVPMLGKKKDGSQVPLQVGLVVIPVNGRTVAMAILHDLTVKEQDCSGNY